jgi:hypothetical protein
MGDPFGRVKRWTAGNRAKGDKKNPAPSEEEGAGWRTEAAFGQLISRIPPDGMREPLPTSSEADT